MATGRAREGRPPPAASGRSELGARVLVAVPAIAVAVALITVGGYPFAVALLLLAWACVYELYGLFPDAKPAKLAGYLAVAGLVAAATLAGRDQVLLVAVAAIPLTFLLTLFAPGGGTFGVSLTLLGIFWIGLALAYAVLLRRLPHGGGIVIDVLVGTFVGDSAAYLGGRKLGRHKLSPKVSPNKTVEGLLLGIVAAVVSVWLASLYEPWFHDKGYALLLGLSVALAAPIGDLFESYIKRDAGTKDTGRLFGVHGGALDRLDAVLFTAVVGYYVWHTVLLK